MSLLTKQRGGPIKLRLARNLTRTIKRGHPWVFADALQQRSPASPGTHAVLLDNKKGQPLARGFYNPQSPLAFRVCSVKPEAPLTGDWAEQKMNRALALRHTLFNDATTGYRLFNGEGDGLPGLVCDIYQNSAVLQLDGPGPAGFWNVAAIAQWVAKKLSLQQVYLKAQARDKRSGKALVGNQPTRPVPFLENNLHFTADIVNGQKTGFFLDQRDNRRLIETVAANRRVLNLFGYTGGFSVYAGRGYATHVTTVDLAAPAVRAAEHHWRINHLPAGGHQAVKADAFSFLQKAAQKKEFWEMVIVDPPSFTASKNTVGQASAAYHKLIAGAATVTNAGGLLAAASCSSHINMAAFLAICEEGVSKARRRATTLAVNSQPSDHPAPLPLSEFRYLKFVLMRID